MLYIIIITSLRVVILLRDEELAGFYFRIIIVSHNIYFDVDLWLNFWEREEYEFQFTVSFRRK